MKREDLELLQQALDKISALENENARLKAANVPIAVVGMGCRLPGGVSSAQAYWEFLENGEDGISPLPASRMAWFEALDAGFSHKVTTTLGGYLEGVEEFDPGFFGISPKEARLMDPQQRLLLEVAWEALEDAGMVPGRLRGSKTGVFVGITLTDYAHYLAGQADLGAFGVTSSSHNAAAGRLAYQFGFQGPCMAVDTACSSSLVAIDLAVRYLRAGACDCALAGGVNLILSPDSMVATSEAHMLSPDGHCFTFDAAANGIARGEGCGLVVLKPLPAALAAGDRIYALIAGTAQNNNGAGSGITVPNRTVQAALVQAALADAALTPADVTFVEAHGTATPLGDPIEVNALQAVFGKAHTQDRPLYIGSVKANFGHLEAAAGIAGFMKVALSLYHRSLPPHIHFRLPNPHVEWGTMPIHVVTEAQPLAADTVAGVSSFGATGTNAHLVLKMAAMPVMKDFPAPPAMHLLPLTAKTPSALQALAARYAIAITQETDVHGLCYSARVCREQFSQRAAVVGEGPDSLREALQALAEGKAVPAVLAGTDGSTQASGFVAMFTGQGSQYPGMGKALYAAWPVYRAAVDRCAAAAEGHLPLPLLQVLFEQETPIHSTQYAQPALFALEYALACAVQSFGLQPQAVLGHSLGEYVAACVAGIFSPEVGMQVVCKRGALMQSMPAGGKMAAVMAPVEQVRAQLDSDAPLSIAAVNGPRHTVVSGPAAAMETLLAKCKAQAIPAVPLQVSHAFHSAMMDEARDAFEAYLHTVTFGKARFPLISTLHGRALREEEYTSPAYWARHLREPVDFQAAVQHLATTGATLFLELGPKPVLGRMVHDILGNAVASVHSLRPDVPATQAFFHLLGALHVHGLPLDWSAYDRAYPARRCDLPLYPFQRKPYWLTPQTAFPVRGVATPIPDALTMKNPHIQPAVQKAELDLLDHIAHLVAEITEIPASEVSPGLNLFEMGMDSIMLIRLRQDIAKDFGVEVNMSDFYTEFDTLHKLAAHLAAHATKTPASTPDIPAMPASLPSAQAAHSEGGFLEELIRQQMELMRQQLALLQGQTSTALVPPLMPSAPKPAGRKEAETFVPYRKLESGEGTAAVVEVSGFLRDLVERVNARTASSKATTAQHRAHLANNRAVAGFRPNWKEMVYQLVVERAEGSKVWDQAGQEYVDFTMGFGVYLFGHNPSFVRSALIEALDRGMPLGPMTALAGEVAEQLCAMTGMERAALYNSGTEAVMVALRLARTATGRRKIVIFAGAYHGTFDGILAKQGTGDEAHLGIAMAPGTPVGMIEDVYVLAYGEEASLRFIDAEGASLAAVLVEPVQSRRPDQQPREFLQALRVITAQHGTALIFDEVITGFRIHPGGAQHHFEVRADMATYGKVIGGGMPIGIVAGKAAYLDGVDGGAWEYGDTSYPARKTTFVAGTFCHHPMAMAAALAVMNELRTKGSGLQSQLNHRTAALCETLNAWCAAEEFPLQMVHFGSLFRFVLKGNYELLFYALLERGYYIWEGRNCFLSTAHTEEDVQGFIQAVKSSLLELRSSGLVPAISPATPSKPSIPKVRHQPDYPVSPSQRSIWLAVQMEPDEAGYNLGVALSFRGTLDTSALERALQALIARHDAFRTCFIERDGAPRQVVHESLSHTLEVVSLEEGDEWSTFLAHQGRIVLELETVPLWRMQLLRLDQNHHILAIVMHHIISDGWSMNVLMHELLALYEAMLQGKAATLPPLAFQYRDYAVWHDQAMMGSQGEAARTYWHELLSRSVGKLPLEAVPYSAETSRLRKTYPTMRHHALRQLGQRCGGSLFSLLQSLLAVVLHKRVEADTIALGTPMAARMQPGLDGQVGLYLNMVTLHVEILDPDEAFSTLVQRTHAQNQQAYDHQEYPYDLLVRDLKPIREEGGNPFFEVELALDSFDRNTAVIHLANDSLEVRPIQHPSLADPRKYVLEFKFMEQPDGLLLDVLYDPARLKAGWVDDLVRALEHGMEVVAASGEIAVGTLEAACEKSKGRAMQQPSVKPLTRTAAGAFTKSQAGGAHT